MAMTEINQEFRKEKCKSQVHLGKKLRTLKINNELETFRQFSAMS